MDIKMVWTGLNGALECNKDIETDEGLETAVITSLFTDKRAPKGVELPAGEVRRRGWWGDSLLSYSDEYGSLLWLLCREKETRNVVLRAEEYAKSALQWLIQDGVAKQIDVYGEIPSPGVLHLLVQIWRPGRNDSMSFKYAYNWKKQEVKPDAI